MMGTCKTCKHWDKSDQRFGPFGVCGEAVFTRPQVMDWMWSNRIGDPVVTGPDFGCIHHEEK